MTETEQRSCTMARIRGKDTKPEVLLRKALWRRGIRCRKNYRKLPGSLDIALIKRKIAILVDGDFWHARGNHQNPGEQVRSNKEYWAKHLARNVERDREVDGALTEEGWLVLRFWGSDIKKDIEGCIGGIEDYL